MINGNWIHRAWFNCTAGNTFKPMWHGNSADKRLETKLRARPFWTSRQVTFWINYFFVPLVHDNRTFRKHKSHISTIYSAMNRIINNSLYCLYENCRYYFVLFLFFFFTLKSCVNINDLIFAMTIPICVLFKREMIEKN